MCVAIPFILDVRLVDVPAEVTQEKGHTGFIQFYSVVLAEIFSRKGFSRSIPSLTVKSNFWTNDLIALHLLGIFIYLFIFVGKNPSSCDCIEILTHVPTSEGFEVTNCSTGATGSTFNRLHYFVLYCSSMLSVRVDSQGAGAIGCSYETIPLQQPAGR